MSQGIFRQRRLPHLDVEDGTYFVTSCLAGSIPAQGLADLQRYRDELESRTRAQDSSEIERELLHSKLLFARMDEWLDLRSAVNHLQVPAIAEVVRGAFLHFAGERYDLLAYVVMPSHFHWVFRPRKEWQTGKSAPRSERPRSLREQIMQSIKGFTAYRCNQLLGRSGSFWQDESYDHVVRNDAELLRIIEYVEYNPVKAGLASSPEAWPWSSAADRAKRLGRM